MKDSIVFYNEENGMKFEGHYRIFNMSNKHQN